MNGRCSLALTAFLVLSVAAPAQEIDPETYRRVTQKAHEFLKTTQNADGSWSTPPRNLGVTGIIVTGLIQSGTASTEEPTVAKALKFIEGLVNPKAGHIAGSDAKIGLQNYVTSVNVMALIAAKSDKYKTVVSDAVAFLKKLQWDEGEGKSKEDDFFGGAGYDSKSRPDLSNTQFFLDALKSAGITSDDPAVKNALVFVSRCQNFQSEHNTKPWAGKINDGSFIYTAAGGGETKADNPKGDLLGYGSMTYAGIKSMIYCGVSKDDPRFKKALEWISANYTLQANPGMPPGLEGRGLYYYYHTFAKTLDALGVDEITDAKGVKHRWRNELFAELLKRQQADGSWTNPVERWMENDPQLVTGYALMALSYCRPKPAP